MIQQLDANILAQIAINNIEETEVTNIFSDMVEALPCQTPDHHAYDQLFAANQLTKAAKATLDTFKNRVIELLKKRRTKDSVTITLGTRMFKFYYNRYFTWENLHLQPKKDETDEEKAFRQKVEAALADYNEKLEAIHDTEADLRILKQQKKVAEETLAVLLPGSDCIKYTPVLQVSATE